MERRMLLAVVLSIFSVVAYSALTGRGCSRPPPTTDTTPEGANGDPASSDPSGKDIPAKASPGKDDGANNGGPGIPAPKDGDTPGADTPKDGDLAKHPQRAVEKSWAVLTSEELEVTLTSQSGAVAAVRLLGATEGDQETPFDAVVPLDERMLFGATDDTNVTPVSAPGGEDRHEMAAGPMRSALLQWTHDEAAEKATPDTDAIFTFTTPGGLIYTKQWILSKGENRYDVTLKFSVRSAPGAKPTATTVDVAMLTSSGHLREDIRGAFAHPNDILWRLSGEADLSDDNKHGIGIQELPTEGSNRARLAVFGVRTAYFLSMYYRIAGADEPDITHFWATGDDISRRGAYDKNLARFWQERRDIDVTTFPTIESRIQRGLPVLLHCWVVARMPVQAGVSAEAAQKNAKAFHFYVGPTNRGTVRQAVYEPLASIITYPNAPDFVGDILLWIYDFWLGLFGSAGLAVILMTMCVRGGLMPLSVRNQLSMRKYGRKVAKLKPKVAALQKKHEKNPKKLRDEQMKLYRANGVGFPSGCLMMLIQIPIFFSLFSALRIEYTLRGESFLWIKDLAGPDRLIDFGERVIDLSFFYVESINLLPLLMVCLSILHTRSMPKPADEQQAQQMKMMKWLPIVFAFILYNYTAALAIYMVLSSTVAIIESKIVRAKDDADQAKDAEEAKA